MRYVPNLIPEKNRVLKEYFNGSSYSPSKRNAATVFFSWLSGSFFFLSALAFIRHPWACLLFASIGFILAPPGHDLVEKKLRFRWTIRFKALIFAGLLVSTFPLMDYYRAVDQQEAYEEQMKAEREQKELAIAEKNDQQRKDHFTYSIQQVNQLQTKHKLKQAIARLQHASIFAHTAAEREAIKKKEFELSVIQVTEWVNTRKYQAALPLINNLLHSDSSNTQLLYNRAICYSSTGRTAEAVADLQPLMQANYPGAEKLHETINPLRKRIIGYETLCCDGSISYARGRGACSHHGGVCNWDQPIYQPYRKYE